MISEEVYERNDISENWREAVMKARGKPIKVLNSDNVITEIALSNGTLNQATITTSSLVPYEDDPDTDNFFNMLTGD